MGMQFSHFLKRKVCSLVFRMEKQSLKRNILNDTELEAALEKKGYIFELYLKKIKRCSNLFNCCMLFSYKEAEEKMMPCSSKMLCRAEPALPPVHGYLGERRLPL